MKTKHSPGKDDPILGFCRATSESRESALFFIEGFGWDLDDAVSGFLQGHLPPVKKPLQRSRSRSPSRRSYYPAAGLKSKFKMDAVEISKTLDDSREQPIRLPKDYEFEEEVLYHLRDQALAAKIREEFLLPFSDLESDSAS